MCKPETGVVPRTFEPVPEVGTGFCIGVTYIGATESVGGRSEMTTKLLYYEDAYLREFDAIITDIETSDSSVRVTLDQSAFYPGGGGQLHDQGSLVCGGVEFAVSKVKKESAKIWHWLATDGGEPSISVGDPIHARLDWERRYALMRTHTAMHILCGVVWRDYGAQVTGGNMDIAKGRMDFEFEELTREQIGEIEARCNEEIGAARTLQTEILPRDVAFQIPDLIRTKINLLPVGITEVRTVNIVGLDLQADGGTHVNNTAEVGPMTIVDYKSKGKMNKRLYFELGKNND